MLPVHSRLVLVSMKFEGVVLTTSMQRLLNLLLTSFCKYYRMIGHELVIIDEVVAVIYMFASMISALLKSISR